jgi:hypothetical protein
MGLSSILSGKEENRKEEAIICYKQSIKCGLKRNSDLFNQMKRLMIV